MTRQKSSARKITVTREMLRKAARCNETWRELYIAIQTHPRIEIEAEIATEPNVRVKGDLQWQAA